jgi:hypothetical protein
LVWCVGVFNIFLTVCVSLYKCVCVRDLYVSAYGMSSSNVSPHTWVEVFYIAFFYTPHHDSFRGVVLGFLLMVSSRLSVEM